MKPVLLRREVAILASAGLLVSLAAVALGGPVAAQPPTCAGKVATITDNDGTDADPAVGVIKGTKGPDVIVGTDENDVILGLKGKDVICGGLGHDYIYGGAGNDRLIGGSGDDDMYGGFGSDVLDGGRGGDNLYGAHSNGREGSSNNRDLLKGGRGEDDIYGGPGADTLRGGSWTDYLSGEQGNDIINGGTGDDDCRQGPGSRPVRNCETGDLKVAVTCPASGSPGITTCKVTVRNRGPQETAYYLLLSESTVSGSPNCQPSGWTDKRTHYPALAPGASRKRSFDLDCEGAGGSNRFRAIVDTDALDPRPGNDKDKAVIVFD